MVSQWEKREKEKKNFFFLILLKRTCKEKMLAYAPHSRNLDFLLQAEERNLQRVSLRRHCRESFLLNYFLDEQEARSYHNEIARLGVGATSDAVNDRATMHPEERGHSAHLNADVISLESLGYPRYTVDVHGKVWDTKNQQYLSAKPRATDGACRVHVYNKEAERVCRYVHDLVARAFLGIPPVQLNASSGKVVQPVVAHLNGNMSDNRLANLAWMDKNDGRPRTLITTPYTTEKKNARVAFKNGLFRAVTWSVRCTKSNLLPDWIPVFTWFNFDEADLVRELGIDEDCQTKLRSLFHKARNGQSPIVQMEYDRFELEVDDYECQYFPKQHWREITIANCRPIQVSLGGLVREKGIKGGECFTSIGSGQTHHQNGFKVYYAHPTCAVGGKAWPEISIVKLVLHAWLGNHYWKPFIGEDVEEDNWQSSENYRIVHLDGNPRHNHLLNLAVVSLPESSSSAHFAPVFDDNWAHHVYNVYCSNKELMAASKQQQARKGYHYVGPGHVLDLCERKAGVFSPEWQKNSNL